MTKHKLASLLLIVVYLSIIVGNVMRGREFYILHAKLIMVWGGGVGMGAVGSGGIRVRWNRSSGVGNNRVDLGNKLRKCLCTLYCNELNAFKLHHLLFGISMSVWFVVLPLKNCGCSALEEVDRKFRRYRKLRAIQIPVNLKYFGNFARSEILVFQNTSN